MFKNVFILLIILILSIFQSTNSKKEIMILDGDSFDAALQNSIESKSKLFIIFYINQCPYCMHSINVLKEKIVYNYEEEDEINFALVNLDKQSNVWLGVRFNITRIPFIVLIENKRMYQFQSQFEESVVLKFIEDEKVVEDSVDIPENIGVFNKANVIMRELTERIRTSMQFLFDKYGIKINWNNTMTYILLFIILVIIIYFENKLITGIRKICNLERFLRKNRVPPENKDNVENKENKEKSQNDGDKDKKEIKDNNSENKVDNKNKKEKKLKKE